MWGGVRDVGRERVGRRGGEWGLRMSPPRTLAPSQSDQPLCIEFPGAGETEGGQILTR